MNDDIEQAVFDADLGFESAVPGARQDGSRAARGRRPRSARTTVRTRLGAGAVLVGALGLMGGAYAGFASSSTAADSTDTTAQVSQGRQLYEVGQCITCHGANLQGVSGRGPALIGVGSAATYFQVFTGRMPLAQQGPQAPRKTPKYSEEEVLALGAYIQHIGGGPQVPAGSVRGDTTSIADGGELFRLNCAQCHGATAKGAPLSAGKYAPSLNKATDLVMYTAMQSGPESMPVFSDNQLTPTEKKSIIAYVQTMKASADPGGSGVDRIGPVSEAIVIWVAGVGALMVAILWIGAKGQ